MHSQGDERMATAFYCPLPADHAYCLSAFWCALRVHLPRLTSWFMGAIGGGAGATMDTRDASASVVANASKLALSRMISWRQRRSHTLRSGPRTCTHAHDGR